MLPSNVVFASDGAWLENWLIFCPYFRLLLPLPGPNLQPLVGQGAQREIETSKRDRILKSYPFNRVNVSVTFQLTSNYFYCRSTLAVKAAWPSGFPTRESSAGRSTCPSVAWSRSTRLCCRKVATLKSFSKITDIFTNMTLLTRPCHGQRPEPTIVTFLKPCWWLFKFSSYCRIARTCMARMGYLEVKRSTKSHSEQDHLSYLAGKVDFFLLCQICAYYACFAPSSTAKLPFFVKEN